MKRKNVIQRPKHDKTAQERVERLDHAPAMQELRRMVEAGEIDRDRTLDHLKREERHDQAHRPL
jgi:hypothetical protein